MKRSAAGLRFFFEENGKDDSPKDSPVPGTSFSKPKKKIGRFHCRSSGLSHSCLVGSNRREVLFRLLIPVSRKSRLFNFDLRTGSIFYFPNASINRRNSSCAWRYFRSVSSRSWIEPYFAALTVSGLYLSVGRMSVGLISYQAIFSSVQPASRVCQKFCVNSFFGS